MREISKMPVPMYVLKREVEESKNEASLAEAKEGAHT